MEADQKKRDTFLKKLETITPENRVYIDESSIDGNEGQERAWGKKGKLIEAKKSGKHYQRTNVIAGLVGNKSIAPLILHGGCDTELFNNWVEQFLIKELKPGQTVIMDNASFHKSTKMLELIESVGCHVLYLPPYSPDLNPIEKFWANMKRWVQARLTEASAIFNMLCSFFNVPS